MTVLRRSVTRGAREPMIVLLLRTLAAAFHFGLQENFSVSTRPWARITIAKIWLE